MNPSCDKGVSLKHLSDCFSASLAFSVTALERASERSSKHSLWLSCAAKPVDMFPYEVASRACCDCIPVVSYQINQGSLAMVAKHACRSIGTEPEKRAYVETCSYHVSLYSSQRSFVCHRASVFSPFLLASGKKTSTGCWPFSVSRL